MKKSQQASLVKAALDHHQTYWDTQKTTMEKYLNVYNTEFFKGQQYWPQREMVETSDGYTFIEAYMGSLFTKAPSVVVGEDALDPKDGTPVEILCNRFFEQRRHVIERAARLALIYPMSFVKLSVSDMYSEDDDNVDIFNAVDAEALFPWDVIIDDDATTWEKQRFIGHRYTLTLTEFKDKYGKKDVKPGDDTYDLLDDVDCRDQSRANLPKEYQYVHVVEFYDLVTDTLIIFSPDYKRNDGVLETLDIPLRTHDGRPLVPIVPLYFAQSPHKPLLGYSSMARIYDQIREKNMLRSAMANSVRKDSRQYIVQADAFDEDELTKLAIGEEGAIIAVDDLNKAKVIPVPQQPVNRNFNEWASMLEQDLQRGTILSPQTRGEATKATATEVNALTFYTSSEIGRLARERDGTIENMARIYIRMMYYLLEAPETYTALTRSGQPVVFQGGDLDAKWNIKAVDGTSNPIAKRAKGEALVSLSNLLLQAGVNPRTIVEELVDAFELPQSLIPDEQPEGEPAPQGSGRLTDTALEGALAALGEEGAT